LTKVIEAGVGNSAEILGLLGILIPPRLASFREEHLMRRRSNPLSERNIKRIDTRPDSAKQTHGFQVCISLNGALHTKHFSDALYGGLKGSLKKARAYRDAMLSDMPPMQASRIAHTTNVKNKSGHVGISYRKYKTAKGKVTRLIAVSVRAEKGRTVSRVFRYTNRDHDLVLRRAVAFREKLLQARLKREGGVSGIMKANGPMISQTKSIPTSSKKIRSTHKTASDSKTPKLKKSA
jgi:hypothetical protein